MAEYPVTTLTESSDGSDDGSSDESPPKKRPKSVFTMSYPGVDNQGLSDRGSTDFSLPEDASDEESPMAKMMKETKPAVFIDNKAQKMMEKMGYRAGKGLGKHSQGRVDPVEVSRQRGRRGLGLHLPGLEAADIEWNSEMEVVKVEESVAWLEEQEHVSLTEEDFNLWYKEGLRKLTIDDEANFCDPKLLKNVLNCKTVFDKLDPEEMRKARTRSNPFETIRGAFFLNRAAMKMANMDRVFDSMFTDPKNEMGDEVVGPNDLLYFADVCAGPGGFSEYVLWRRKWRAKGFGFTLKGDNDFRLSDFYAGPSETFEPYYGVNGIDGDGNVFDPDNIRAFKEFVMNQTQNKGVHFMMADGGFSVEGQENIQEILSKQLYLCQFLVALCIVQEGGHFICKLFDLFTPFSVGLVYLMYKSFKKISIHKPNTSRPANSERYIICKWKRNDCDAVTDYMFRINQRLWKFGTSKQDVTDIVDLSILEGDKQFFEYIVESNNSLGERQIVNLVKIAAFCRDTSLAESKQAEMRKHCLEYWDIPDKARTAPPRVAPESKCEELLRSTKKTTSFMSEQEKEIHTEILSQVFKSVYDWHCVVMGSSHERRNCTFFLGLGRNRVYRWESNKWQKVDGNLELSPDTLIYAEMVQELRGEGKSQRKMNSLHIIDAIVLGGVDIHSQHLTVRKSLCCKFAKAHQKPSRTDLIPIRVKELYDLEKIDHVFERLKSRVIKGAGSHPRTVFVLDDIDERFFVPGGLLFIKATQEPWMRYLSKSTKHKYYASPHSKDSVYDRDRPSDACADFVSGYSKRHVWWWDEGVAFDNYMRPDEKKLQKQDISEFVHKKCNV